MYKTECFIITGIKYSPKSRGTKILKKLKENTKNYPENVNNSAAVAFIHTTFTQQKGK